jgi:hypothetical protein
MNRLTYAVVVTPFITFQAAAFEASNGVTVNPVSATTFDVIEGDDFGPRGIWCAAADYAETQLGLDDSDRIYVFVPRGDSQTAPDRKGVVFTTDPMPEAGGFPLLFQTIRVAGSSLPTHHAKSFCTDSQLNRSN